MLTDYKKYSLLFLIALTLSLGACKMTSQTTVTTDVEGPTVIQKPVVADLEVKEERISGTATAKGSTPLGEMKQMAISDALTKAKADVLVEPRYEVTKSFSKITVNVTGYPATYKNFRSMEAQDTIFIDKTQLSSSNSSHKPMKKNGRKKKIAAWTIGGVAGAVGIFFLTVLFL